MATSLSAKDLEVWLESPNEEKSLCRTLKRIEVSKVEGGGLFRGLFEPKCLGEHLIC